MCRGPPRNPAHGAPVCSPANPMLAVGDLDGDSDTVAVPVGLSVTLGVLLRLRVTVTVADLLGDKENEDVLDPVGVTVSLSDVLGVPDDVSSALGVSEADAVTVGVRDGDGVTEGGRESVGVGEDDGVGTASWNAYNLPSCDAMNRVPSAPSAGEASTAPLVANAHFTAPVAPTSAYTLKSVEPIYTVPSEPMSGDAYDTCAPVV